MKLARRKFLHLAAGAAALPAVSRVATAQTYPTRPVRIIVGFAAGGGADIAARLIGQWLSERFGQSFVIENRPGAGSNIAAETVLNAPPDGHTLLLATVSNAVNATLYEKLNFRFTRDVAPIAGIIRVPMVILVNASFPAKTVPEFIAYTKANPGKVSVASGGNGSSGHMASELFRVMTGVSMVHVPYRGQGPAFADLIGGQVQVLFATTPGTTDFIKTSKLRGLAVTTASKAEVLPELPTVADFLPGYDASQWYGVGAAKKTRADIVERLNKAINAALTDPAMKVRFADIGGGEMLPGSPSDFGKLIVDETEKWAKVIRAANIKPE